MVKLLPVVRTAVTYAIAIPFTAVAALIVVTITLVHPTSANLDRIARAWGRTWCWAAGVKLEVQGLEHIDPQRSYVVVSNHQSAFDIFAHFAALPVPIRFLAKAELFKIPLFGLAMKRIGMVEVDRGAGRAAHQAINEGAKKTIGLGWSLMIYPEGTRSKDGKLLPFKKGAFSIARKVGAPIVPTAIIGSRAVWEPRTKLIRPGRITLKIMPPISTEGLKIYELENLRNQAVSLISEALGQTAHLERAGR